MYKKQQQQQPRMDQPRSAKVPTSFYNAGDANRDSEHRAEGGTDYSASAAAGAYDADATVSSASVTEEIDSARKRGAAVASMIEGGGGIIGQPSASLELALSASAAGLEAGQKMDPREKCDVVFSGKALAADALLLIAALFSATYAAWELARHGHHVLAILLRGGAYLLVAARCLAYGVMRTFGVGRRLRGAVYSHRPVVGVHVHRVDEMGIAGSLLLACMSEFVSGFGSRAGGTAFAAAALALLISQANGVFRAVSGSYAADHRASEMYRSANASAKFRGRAAKVVHSCLAFVFCFLVLLAPGATGFWGLAAGLCAIGASGLIVTRYALRISRTLISDASSYASASSRSSIAQSDQSAAVVLQGGRTNYVFGVAAVAFSMLATLVAARGAAEHPGSDAACASIAFAAWTYVACSVPECGYGVPLDAYADAAKRCAISVASKVALFFEVNDDQILVDD
jgi:hypothetical protein